MRRPEGISNRKWKRMRDEAAREQAILVRRMKILRELRQRTANYDGTLDTFTHTIRYRDRDVSVSEREYLWLYVRGHLRMGVNHPVVMDDTHIRLKEDASETETNRSEPNQTGPGSAS
jgi:hypothetical protein